MCKIRPGGGSSGLFLYLVQLKLKSYRKLVMFDETAGQNFLEDYMGRIAQEEEEAARLQYAAPDTPEFQVDPGYARDRDIMNQGLGIDPSGMAQHQIPGTDTLTGQPMSPLLDHPDMPPGEDDGRYDPLTGMPY